MLKDGHEGVCAVVLFVLSHLKDLSGTDEVYDRSTDQLRNPLMRTKMKVVMKRIMMSPMKMKIRLEKTKTGMILKTNQR